jgi:hypothetical protein
MRINDLHLIGVKLPNGGNARFFGALDNDEFEPFASDGLPNGWIAWHITDKEIEQQSPRIDALRKVPLIYEPSGDFAKWKEWLKHGWNGQRLATAE